MPFLPISREELEGQADLILITGEAYCDHPSFGHAIISRIVEREGLSVGIIAQPQCDEDYMRLGEPKYGFLISGGVVDSMVNNYTVAKLPRKEDVYSEGGRTGRRPDRCVTVYTKNLKKIYPNSAVAVGGIEASLRRFAHYDYWSDSVMPSILVTSGADLLLYGMGEISIAKLCGLLSRGIPLANIKDLPGTCYLSDYLSLSAKVKHSIESNNALVCPSYEAVKTDKKAYCKAFTIESRSNDSVNGKLTVQKHGALYVVQNPPETAANETQLDSAYALPYMRDYHPMYKDGVPAMTEVKFSVTSHRGCFGSCSYCALTYHQGRVISRRSEESIVDEARELTRMPDFKGYIHDIGGATANFRQKACDKQVKSGVCPSKNCIGYQKCDNLKVSHSDYLKVLRSVRALPKVKKVFIRSGVRYDYILYDKSDEFMRELIKYHVSGQLKVAPEHTVDGVLKLMNKPSFKLYKQFKEKFDGINDALGLKQYLVPYLISSHPGAGLKEAVKVAEYLHSIGYMPEQVQDFYPTPSTKSTCMYYTGLNPDDFTPVYVAVTREEKAMQRALLQYRRKSNYALVKKALILAGREDLIGFTKNCLIRPTKNEAMARKAANQTAKNNIRAGKKGKKTVKVRVGNLIAAPGKANNKNVKLKSKKKK